MKNRSWMLIPLLAFAVILLALPAFGRDLSASVAAVAPTGNKSLNVEKNTIAPGVSVMGKDMSGLTYANAVESSLSIFDRLMASKLYASTAEGDETWRQTLAELGVYYDTDDTINGLSKCVLEGSLLSRYKKAKDHQREPVNFESKAIYNESYIRETVLAAVEGWNREPSESTATCITGELVITPGLDGHQYDFTEALDRFFEALKEGTVSSKGYELIGTYTTVKPSLSAETVENFTLLGTCTTNYPPVTDQLDRNRQQNLIRSTSNMSGRVFAPGEVISALNLYGSITIANGYAEAGTYSTTGHTDEIGGGICQTTSTMYNAVLQAELEIVYRRNHSYLISYLPPSHDAMVYAPGGSDFKFRNSSSDYIIIDAYVNTETRSVTVNIIGHEDHPATHSVRYESVLISVNGSQEKLNSMLNQVVDESLQLGWKKNKVRFPVGFSLLPETNSQLWKISIDNGVETRTMLSNDRYKAMPGTIYVSADIEVRPEIREDSAIIDLYYYFKGTDIKISDNPAAWTNEERAEFNKTMREQFPDWPYEGASYNDIISGDLVVIPYDLPGEDSGEEGGSGDQIIDATP